MLFTPTTKRLLLSVVTSVAWHPTLAGLHLTAVRWKTIPSHLKGKSSSSQRWLTRQLNDPYVKKARYCNYRARSAFKLIELDDQFHLLRRGMAVVECGAAPGAWTQVLVQRCDSKSALIVAIDKNPMNPVPGAHILPNTDFASGTGQAKILNLLSGRRINLLCSDMAPNASGHTQLDHEAIAALATSALSFALQVLAPNGTFLTKMWGGTRVTDMHKLMDRFFTSVHEVKPPASRVDSAELFIVATGFTGIRK